MQNSLLANPLSSKGDSSNNKSWLSKPEAKFGLLFGLGLTGIVGFYILPILTTIIWNTINFGIAITAGALFLFLITNKKLRLSAYYLYEIVMKQLLGIVIELDPFIIAEDYINDMKKAREDLNDEVMKVDKQKELLFKNIKEKEKSIIDNMQRAEVAQRKGLNDLVTLATNDVGRGKGYIERLTPILTALTNISEYLKKVYDNSEFTIKDAESELSYKKDEYKALTAGSNALKSAMKIFKGDADKKILLDQSAEFLKDDMANKLAYMKRSIELTTGIMKNIDLDNAVFEEKGMKMLSEMKQNSINLPINNQPIILNKNQNSTINIHEQYKGLL